MACRGLVFYKQAVLGAVQSPAPTQFNPRLEAVPCAPSYRRSHVAT